MYDQQPQEESARPIEGPDDESHSTLGIRVGRVVVAAAIIVFAAPLVGRGVEALDRVIGDGPRAGASTWGWQDSSRG